LEQRHRPATSPPRGGDRGWKADGVPDRQVAIAVGEARRIADVTWRYKAEQRVVAAIGHEIHRRAKAGSASGTCDALAALATDLDEGKKAALKALERAAVPLLELISKPRLARLIAHLFVLHITAVPAAKVDAVVAALRAYGVLLCVLNRRDLQRCRCLRALAVSEIDERIRSEVRDVVGHGLEQLGQEAQPFV
jgi:hypothetical protein